MTHRKFLACAASGALALMASETARADDQTATAPPPATPAAAAPAPVAAAPTPPPYPAMSPTLAADANSPTFDLGLLGHKVTISGAVTGLGFVQNNTVTGDQDHRFDISNGQVFINKTDGIFQYFVQVGLYSLPDLGTPYVKSTTLTQNTYDPVPQAFLKIAPNSTWSIQIGKLPTLIGAEYTFSFENMNIERGLLWNQEPAVSRGVQLNYTKGKLALSVSWNDGLYSNRYTWVSAAATVTFNSSNTLEFVGGRNLKRTSFSDFATPLFANNEEIYNVIYTHTHGPWTIEPYVQYTYVPALPTIGSTSASTWGAALFVSYAFDAKSKLAGFSLPVRFEYISSTGSGAGGAPNLLYGPGSNAWSVTVTPTYQYKIYFVRAELSYVSASSITPGFAFGPAGDNQSQTRGLLETGVLF